MKSNKHQTGMSMLVMIVIIGLFGYAIFIGIKVTPVYMEFYSIRSIVDGLADEMKVRPMNKNQYLDLLIRRLNINYVEVRDLKPSRDGCEKTKKKEVFVFKKEKKKIVIGLDYEKRIPMVANIDFLLQFNYLNEVVPTSN